MRLRPDAAGWVLGARRIASPNFDARPPGLPIVLLVVHCISLPRGVYGGPQIAQLFTNHPFDAQASAQHDAELASLAGLQVSSHFLIRRDGALIQFVSCDARAWHAGVSFWKGRERCNDFSIGIELEGVDDGPYTQAQYAVLLALQSGLAARYPLRAQAAHSDIAPGRKTDPGSHFDWTLATRGLPRDPG